MKHLAVVLTVTSLTFASGSARGAEAAKDYAILPVPFTAVQIDDDFWSARLETNRKVTIPYAFQKCEETDRISNFAKAGGLMEGVFQGTYFNDSDVYKIVEGAAYALALKPDPRLDKYLDDLIAKFAAAQEDDGYLYTSRTALNPKNMPPGGKERWSNISAGHELYCVGHMYEAACAHFQATGKRSLLEVALKNADLIDKVFGPDGRHDPPGHQEIEIGLARLYRVTGEERYLKLAKFFLDRRGRLEGRKRLYGEYSQDHKPVIEQSEGVGHSVRAGYLYTGMADVAALTGDPNYVGAIGRIWDDVLSKKLYITGGIGAAGGHEGFGEPYNLPNLRAYCETCASIANAMWNQRMFLMHGDSQYMDLVERIIYNGFLSGISLEGNRFFYPNPLESYGGSRAEWFGCACCPSNVARFVPSIPGYAYAHRDDRLYVNLYIAGGATIPLKEGPVKVTQKTRYPWEGAIAITVEPEKSSQDFMLHLRIPGWARNTPVPGDLYHYAKKRDEQPTLKVNGKAQKYAASQGFARIERTWKKGDVVELDLPMPVRRVLAHENIVDDRGRVALERGPLVYCAEGVDNHDGRVLHLMLEDGATFKPEHRKELLGGVTVLRGQARIVKRAVAGAPQAAPGAVDFTAIPYYAWCHRERGQMAVWLAREVGAAKPEPAPTLARTSKVTVSGGGSKDALTDQLEPSSSIDHSNPFFHWWPRKGTLEWVELEFKQPTAVAECEIYWFDDTGMGECRLPRSWRLLYKDGGEWKPVKNAGPYLVEKDKYCKIEFERVKTAGLRLEVQFIEKFSGGIHEWRVK